MKLRTQEAKVWFTGVARLGASWLAEGMDPTSKKEVEGFK